MKNPFETSPGQETPKEDDGVDIDVSDFTKEFGSGNEDFDPAELARRHEEEGRKVEAERIARWKDAKAVANAYFSKYEMNPFLKFRFKDDLEAKARFIDGLAGLIERVSMRYGYERDDVDHLGLVDNDDFSKDLLAYAAKFEKREAELEEQRRLRGGRAA